MVILIISTDPSGRDSWLSSNNSKLSEKTSKSSNSDSSERDESRSRRRRGTAPESNGFSGDENQDYGGAEG